MIKTKKKNTIRRSQTHTHSEKKNLTNGKPKTKQDDDQNMRKKIEKIFFCCCCFVVSLQKQYGVDKLEIHRNNHHHYYKEKKFFF